MRKLIAPIIAASLLAAGTLVPAEAAGDTYLVGAATREIHPDAPGSPLVPGTAVRKGGSGLGDGSSPVSQAVGAGGLAKFEGDAIRARAIVIEDTAGTAIAFATVETQGMFAAYQRDLPGLRDIAEAVEVRTAGALDADRILISNDHTHSGPDLIGAWGFVPDAYARFIAEQTEDAIVEAWERREAATLAAGADDAPDMIYNQNCLEALNQGANDTYPMTPCNPTQEEKDGWVRALQARAIDDDAVIATMVVYAAHATLGGGSGLHGDWPQFLGDHMADEYGGIGLAFQGSVGRSQPCRPRCGFTDRERPGYELPGRRQAYVTMLMYHVRRALLGAPAIDGAIKAARSFIRHEVSNPALLALTQQGGVIGAPIARSLDAPWTVGSTVLTPVSAFGLGWLLVTGAPGEAYPNIGFAVSDATNTPIQRTWTISLADDQLGYLIAPLETYGFVLAEAGVNDNSIFNVSPTIGDHVACAQTRLAGSIGFGIVRADPRCVAWDAVDALGDPLGTLPD